MFALLLQEIRRLADTLWMVRALSLATIGASGLGIVASVVLALGREEFGVTRSSAALIVGGFVALAFRSTVPLADALLAEPEWVDRYVLLAAAMELLGALALVAGVTRVVAEATR